MKLCSLYIQSSINLGQTPLRIYNAQMKNRKDLNLGEVLSIYQWSCISHPLIDSIYLKATILFFKAWHFKPAVLFYPEAYHLDEVISFCIISIVAQKGKTCSRLLEPQKGSQNVASTIGTDLPSCINGFRRVHCCMGGNPAIDCSRENNPSHFILQKLELNAGLMG